MKFELPPAIVRLLFVLGVIAAGAAVYELAQGARAIALGLGVSAATRTCDQLPVQTASLESASAPIGIAPGP